jgi:hypothetical protein
MLPKSAASAASPHTAPTQQAELTANDGASGDQLGGYSQTVIHGSSALAVSESTMVVGAPLHATGGNTSEGAAYVFSNSSGNWTQVGELTASDGGQGDFFGDSVAVSGSTIVVGAEHKGDGAAYVFSGSGTTWHQDAELTDPAPPAGNVGQFGHAVAISGSTIVVGASQRTTDASAPSPHNFAGAAYVFSGSGTTWHQDAELTASDRVGSDQFGTSVAISGTTIAVGAPFHRVGTNSSQGATYLFDKTGGSWSQTTELTAAVDGNQGDELGMSVAISGSTVVAGAPLHHVGSNDFQGTAYVFGIVNSLWQQTAELTATDGAAGDALGRAVAISGSTIVAGVPAHQVGANASQGVAYVFTDTGGGTWAQSPDLVADDGAASDLFGKAVAVSDTNVFAGAPSHLVGSHTFQGAVYVFGTPPEQLNITSVTIDPESPSSSDATITGTITVENIGDDPLTNVSAAVGSATPKIVTIASQPTPSGVSLAEGASTEFTFVMTPKKGGDASIAVGAGGSDAGSPVTATVRTRNFTIDGGITLKLAVAKGPDSDGKATLSAKVSNPGSGAVSGITLDLSDVTGARQKADIGKPDPTSFALGSHDSKKFTVKVTLPAIGDYDLSGTARGKSHGAPVDGSDTIRLTRDGKALSVEVTPKFKRAQMDEKGDLEVTITNHLNSKLTGVTTTATAPSSKDSGQATIGTLPAPVTVAGKETVRVPARLTYPGPVAFHVKVTGTVATTGERVSETAKADVDVPKPEFTVERSTNKKFKDDAVAVDWEGKKWSTAAGPIDVREATLLLKSYPADTNFSGSIAFPLFINHIIGGQDEKKLPDHPCSSPISAQQGSYRKNTKIEGKADRLLLFADADPFLKTNMILCDKELNYVDTTPGTAMYFSREGGLGTHEKLVVVRAGDVRARIVAQGDLDVCVDLTDGVRSVRVKAAGPELHFAIRSFRCPSHHI